MKKIKEIKIVNQDESTELANIGADAVNVDYNNTNVKSKLDELSNNIDTNTTNISNEMITRANAVTNLQSQINGLASGSPLVASSVSEMTDTSRVYVNTTDGHWYYYNGTAWADGGPYQSSIDIDQTNYNRINIDYIANNFVHLISEKSYIDGYYDSDGETIISSSGWITTDFVELDAKKIIYLDWNGGGNIYTFDSNKNFIERKGRQSSERFFEFNSNVSYVKLTLWKSQYLTAKYSFSYTKLNLTTLNTVMNDYNKILIVCDPNKYINYDSTNKTLIFPETYAIFYKNGWHGTSSLANPSAELDLSGTAGVIYLDFNESKPTYKTMLFSDLDHKKELNINCEIIGVWWGDNITSDCFSYNYNNKPSKSADYINSIDRQNNYYAIGDSITAGSGQDVSGHQYFTYFNEYCGFKSVNSDRYRWYMYINRWK